ncbi:nucleotidyltransferase domain-containing protein [Microlunatus soli]|uniref:Nucleotidyltransferase domain-containing protein n=1 Tax=Microlunatus soli TaxID=630515 RepID=A0A1H1ZZV5_9ACTN|nr:nucleotidyltransferase domain-containing protein [Microlunatus soli]SDT39213.1 Nucleotidyltransferase domain-containing protein [Microlunatus soli]
MGGIDVIDPRYTAVFARAQQVLGDDHRVRSVGPGGSVGAGTADRWSDLDLAIATEPEHHQDFIADWPNWLRRITPTVFARTPIAPFIINTVTDQGLTLDVVVHSGEVPIYRPPAGYAVGFASSRYETVAAALEYAVAEQLRGLAGPFISLIQREEHLRHLTGVPHVIGLLTTVFLAETGEQQPGKTWNSTYTEEQRQLVAALPAARATREDMIAFGLAVARLIVERARPLFADHDLEWPADLAQVTAGRLRDQLGLDTTDWLR